jgi:histidyl-tRNA synthetase
MFGGETVPGIGFGMGDVSMRDFLEARQLLPISLKGGAAHVVVIPLSQTENLPAQAIAHQIRQAGFSVSTDIGTRKMQKKFTEAKDSGAKFVIMIGEDEVQTGTITIKNLNSGVEQSGQLAALMNFLSVE